jgi:hypothetical protein
VEANLQVWRGVYGNKIRTCLAVKFGASKAILNPHPRFPAHLAEELDNL